MDWGRRRNNKRYHEPYPSNSGSSYEAFSEHSSIAPRFHRVYHPRAFYSHPLSSTHVSTSDAVRIYKNDPYDARVRDNRFRRSYIPVWSSTHIRNSSRASASRSNNGWSSIYGSRGDYQRRRLLPRFKDRGSGVVSSTKVLFVWAVIGFFLLLVLALGLGFGIVLNQDSKKEGNSTVVTTAYVLTYELNATFDSRLLDLTSSEYLTLRRSVIEALEPICECQISNVTFRSGSVITAVVMQLPDTVKTEVLRESIQVAAREGLLLPGYDVNDNSITIAPQDTAVGQSITSQELVNRPTTQATTPHTSRLEPTTERTTAQPTTEPKTLHPTTEDRTLQPTADKTTVQPTTDQPSLKPTTEETTVQPTTEQTTLESTTEETTLQPTTQQTTFQPSTDKTTAQPTTDQTTLKPTTEESNVQPTTEQATLQSTPEETTFQPTTEETTVQQTTEPTTILPTTEEATSQPAPEKTIVQWTTEQTTPEQTTGKSTTQITTEETTLFSKLEQGYSTLPVAPPQEPPEITEFKGLWTDWTAWSSCSKTCSSGSQTRTRNCIDNQICLGTAEQEKFCSTQPCPKSVIFAVWSSWGQWSDCTVTCGGGIRVRQRSCNTDETKEYCTGSNNQTEPCNHFDCPDCSMTCEEGSTLSIDCTHCVCNSTIYAGQVISRRTQLPLQNVTISPHNMPDSVLEVTSVDGKYNISGPCGETQLLFRKDGYVDSYRSANTSNGTVTMTKIEPLDIVENPFDKKRLVGENVSLCCSANGEPSPKYFEWLKDDEIIHIDYVEIGRTSSSLHLSNLTLDNDDFYQCRANNDYSARYSARARLTVRESRDDFCQKYPVTRYKSLPSGCFIENDTKIDIGECKKSACRGETPDDGRCGKTESYCCGPAEYTPVSVNCSSHFVTYNVVTKCGCRACLVFGTYIRGTVVIGNSTTAVADAEVWYNDTIVATTDIEGKFNFTINEELERITVTVNPDNSSNLLATTQTLSIGKTETGVFFFLVRLMEMASPVVSQSTDQIVAAINSSNTDKGFGEIIVPSNSFYKEDGELFQGQLELSVTAIKPSDPVSSEIAAGDYSTTDNEGEEQVLNSFGMFRIEVRGDGRKLQAPGEIHIDVPSDVVGNETDADGNSQVKLWSMNKKTGRWEMESNLIAMNEERRRKKRQLPPGVRMYQTTIKGLPIQGTWYNFDAISDKTCYSKVRVFDSDDTALDGVKVGVVVTSGYSGNTVTYNRATTDEGDDNGYCIAHPCDNEFRNPAHSGFSGRIFAEKYGKRLEPLSPADTAWSGNNLEEDLYYVANNDTISVSLHLRESDTEGPFYNWDDRKWRYSNNCSYAESSHNYFQFNARDGDCETTNPDPLDPSITDVWSNDVDLCINTRYFQLYGFPDILELSNGGTIKSCYIKIYVPGYDNVDYVAYSNVGNAYMMGGISPGQLYGSSRNCLIGGTTCLEIKIPGYVACTNIQTETSDAFTKVSIEPVSDSMPPVLRLNSYWNDPDIVIHDNSTTLAFNFIPFMANGGFGIYCEEEATLEAARTSAKAACMGSAQNEWAVRFEEPLPPQCAAFGCCVGYNGTCNAAGCFCDEACVGLGDCCADYRQHCEN